MEGLTDIFNKIKDLNHNWDCMYGVFKTGINCKELDKEFYVRHIELANRLTNDIVGDLNDYDD